MKSVWNRGGVGWEPPARSGRDRRVGCNLTPHFPVLRIRGPASASSGIDIHEHNHAAVVVSVGLHRRANAWNGASALLPSVPMNVR
jgi:hypothetical protein